MTVTWAGVGRIIWLIKEGDKVIIHKETVTWTEGGKIKQLIKD